MYARAGSDILDCVDAGLRSRAEILAGDVRANGPQLANVGLQLIKNDAAFAQQIKQSPEAQRHRCDSGAVVISLINPQICRPSACPTVLPWDQVCSPNLWVHIGLIGAGALVSWELLRLRGRIT